MATKRKLFILAMWLIIVTASTFGSARAEAEPKSVEITAKRFAFSPSDITLKKGQPAVLVVKSDDVAHGIRFRDLGIDLSVHAKGKAEAHFTPQKTGDFVGHCSVFCGAGHGSMTLKIHVVD